MAAQLKVVEDSSSGAGVSAVELEKHPPQAKQDTRPSTKQQCQNCGRRHDLRRRESCPAFGKTCNKCQKRNRFAVKCRSKKGPGVSIVDPPEPSDEEDEVFETHTAGKLEDSQLVTLCIASRNYIRFQVNTGAQCNVVPLELYKKATKDQDLTHVTPAQTRFTAYGGATLPVVGTVLLRVWRGDFHCRLDCKLVDRQDVHPLLGRKACLGMKIISYLDNNQLNKPQTGGAPVYAVEEPSSPSVQQLIKQYPSVFGGGVGLLQGLYHIRLDDTVPPVQHAPRRVR